MERHLMHTHATMRHASWSMRLHAVGGRVAASAAPLRRFRPPGHPAYLKVTVTAVIRCEVKPPTLGRTAKMRP